MECLCVAFHPMGEGQHARHLTSRGALLQHSRCGFHKSVRWAKRIIVALVGCSTCATCRIELNDYGSGWMKVQWQISMAGQAACELRSAACRDPSRLKSGGLVCRHRTKPFRARNVPRFL